MTHDLCRSTPVILVSGVAEHAMLTTSLSVQLGLPGSVALAHVVDGEHQTLTRIVSDVTGVIESEVIDLSHACVSCAIREDVMPTLRRLAATSRFSSIVACLPVGAEPAQLCRVVGTQSGAQGTVRIAAVVAALDGSSLAADLLGDDLLAERGLAITPEDRRGVGEVGCAMVECADLIALTEQPQDDECSLLAALARPGVAVVGDVSLIDAEALVAGVHDHPAVERWAHPLRNEPLPEMELNGAWRLELRSDRPLHPLRFQQELAAIGEGSTRSRGCFWLPTRSHEVCAWDGAGGQVSIGVERRWRLGEERFTRLVIVGLDASADRQSTIAEAFQRCLLTDDELATCGTAWVDGWDGLDPWLGPIEQVA